MSKEKDLPKSNIAVLKSVQTPDYSKPGAGSGYVVGAHFYENTFHPLTRKSQREIFEPDPETTQYENSLEFINLTGAEHLALLTLYKILSKKSINKDPKSPDYLTGEPTGEPETAKLENIESYSAIVKKVPKYFTSFYEIAKEYNGSPPSGGHIKNIKNVLNNLAKKEFKFQYSREEKKGGKTIRQTIKGKRPILFIDQGEQTITDQKTGEKTTVKKEIISLHPITVDQIATKFLQIPEDFVPRINRLYKKTPPVAVLSTIIYVVSIKSPGFHPIYESNLILKADYKTAKKNKDRVIGYIKNALDICRDELGIIKSWEIVNGKKEEPKYIIHYKLSKNEEKTT